MWDVENSDIEVTKEPKNDEDNYQRYYHEFLSLLLGAYPTGEGGLGKHGF